MAIMSSMSKAYAAIRGLFVKENVDATTSQFKLRQQQEKAFEAVERGICEVPLTRVIGSVGRYHDFDHQFKPKREEQDERLKGIKKAMAGGRSLPPIALYQIKEDYYILDGHHRFQAARDLGHSHLRAKIIELLPSKNSLENILYLEKTEFRDRAGLTATIDLTEAGQTGHLDWQIREHQKHLQLEKGQKITFRQAAADWYRTIYRPLHTIIAGSSLTASFPQRTVDDLYLYVSVQQWELGKKRKYGIDLDRLIPTDMEDFRSKMAEHKDQKYPEMKREISVFILLNIDGKYEQQILDRLAALDEVVEIHSVHGSIDLIIRVNLMRDLLSSDAEVLSQFTMTTIRQWKGVQKTQTLIPGMSKVRGADGRFL